MRAGGLVFAIGWLPAFWMCFVFAGCLWFKRMITMVYCYLFANSWWFCLLLYTFAMRVCLWLLVAVRGLLRFIIGVVWVVCVCDAVVCGLLCLGLYVSAFGS